MYSFIHLHTYMHSYIHLHSYINSFIHLHTYSHSFIHLHTYIKCCLIKACLTWIQALDYVRLYLRRYRMTISFKRRVTYTTVKANLTGMLWSLFLTFFDNFRPNKWRFYWKQSFDHCFAQDSSTLRNKIADYVDFLEVFKLHFKTSTWLVSHLGTYVCLGHLWHASIGRCQHFW
jgi:hypothetical protein